MGDVKEVGEVQQGSSSVSDSSLHAPRVSDALDFQVSSTSSSDLTGSLAHKGSVSAGLVGLGSNTCFAIAAAKKGSDSVIIDSGLVSKEVSKNVLMLKLCLLHELESLHRRRQLRKSQTSSHGLRDPRSGSGSCSEIVEASRQAVSKGLSQSECSVPSSVPSVGEFGPPGFQETSRIQQRPHLQLLIEQVCSAQIIPICGSTETYSDNACFNIVSGRR